ncbi:hypothetical protein M3N64_07365 [Sporolactobacillus sp. CPB3-1]|uniref:RDD domain-containing protein n=1 Tax=Sporolactobacillus mangiferae TaxID=2940498 RepID=A0ABT0MA63_9BACL|nr:hypothetical protein [Sporolactobacillus mangiferae]MCL1631766.1 hypothetical protein [Sporolactobacillus mangiferae]
MARRNNAVLDFLGSAGLSYRKPAIIAWWSAAFPGFGHMLLDMHIKGNVLFLFEIIINFNSKLNLAMVYTFMGDFKRSALTLNTQWTLIYIPFYFYCIWDSYITTAKLNRINALTKDKPVTMKVLDLRTYETCFIDKRLPWLASVWSFLLPGLGQVYTRRLFTALSLLSWSVTIYVNSHQLQYIQLIVNHEATMAEAIKVLNPEWLLFMPSLIFGAAYDAYAKTVESNRLFEKELLSYLKFEWSIAKSDLIIKEKRGSDL